MKRTLFCIIAAVCMMGSANAQSIPVKTIKSTKPAMNNEINLMAGIGGSMSKSEPAFVYGGYYSAYSNKGLGFRTGLEFSSGSLEMAKYGGIPIHFLWKYGYQRSLASSLKAGASTAAYNTVRSVLYGQKPNLENALNSFILGLLQNFQFYAGVTPCMMLNMDKIYDFDNDLYYTAGKSNSFGLTADLGLGMSLYLGSLEIGINPAFHYLLAGNGYNLNYTQTNRWYYSTMINVGLIF